MKYIFPCILLALTTCLYADEPKSKAIRKYENEVEVLRKQGQAAIKRLEGVFGKEVEKLRERTLNELQKELDAALEAKDLDKAVALGKAIEEFESAEASGLSAKGEVATEKKVKKRIPRNAMNFAGHRYLLVDGGVTWLSAYKEADRLGGHLVQIDSTLEHDFLIRLITRVNPQNADDHVWIDGSRLLGGGEFCDAAGKPLNLNSMKCTPFDDANSSVLAMYRQHGWYVNDVLNPASKHAFIIEWDN